MDYSIYDAIQAGFGKIVFVIRKDFEAQFREQVLSKYEGHIPAELVFQSLDALPEASTYPRDVRSHGGPTMPCSWLRMSSRAFLCHQLR